MTMIPMHKKCSICKKRYNWNPDLGQMCCPRCGIEKKLGDIPIVKNKNEPIGEIRFFPDEISVGKFSR